MHTNEITVAHVRKAADRIAAFAVEWRKRMGGPNSLVGPDIYGLGTEDGILTLCIEDLEILAAALGTIVNEPVGVPTKCANCGGLFTAMRPNAIYCTDEACGRNRAMNRQRKMRRK